MTLSPLHPEDPPAIGDFELCGRLHDADISTATADSGIVYAGRSDHGDVVVVVLTAGAEQDSYGRARFHDELAAARADTPYLVVAAEDDPDLAPWVAIRAESWEQGAALAAGLLAPVTLADRPAAQQPVGPPFRPHWAAYGDSGRAGRWRLWPLPWPASLTTAARWTFAASFAIVLALAALALFVAVRLFHNLPPAPPPPPFPQPAPSGPTGPATPTPSPPTGPPTTVGPSSGQPTQPPVV